MIIIIAVQMLKKNLHGKSKKLINRIHDDYSIFIAIPDFVLNLLVHDKKI